MASPQREEVRSLFEVYYSVPAHLRSRCHWVMNSAKRDEVAKIPDLYFPAFPVPGWLDMVQSETFCGLPIEIDETATTARLVPPEPQVYSHRNGTK